MTLNKDFLLLKTPNSFNVAKTLTVSPIETKANKGKHDIHREYLLVLIHQILSARKHFQVKVKIFRKDICFPISAEILKKSLRDYKEYLEYLIRTNLIWRTEEDSKGKCATYKICEPHNESPLETHYYFKKPNQKFNTVFNALIVKKKIDYSIAEKFSVQIRSYKTLSVDMRKACQTLYKLYPENKEEINKELSMLKTLNNFKSDDIGDLNTFHCDKQGRLYTPFVSLNKNLRRHYRLNNSPLLEIDLSNSIPFFGLALLLDTNENSYINKRIKEICKEREGDLGKGVYKGVMLRKTGLELKTDVLQYKELVCNGGIYKELGSIWGIDEKAAKGNYLTFCNMPPNQLIDNKKWNEFSLYFPNVAGAIEDVNKNFKQTKKQARKNKTNKNRKLCAYAIITQTLESDFILDLIMPQVHDTNPEVKMISIHDAIYTTVQYSDLISETIQDVCQNYLGYYPSVKVKSFNTKP